MSSETHDELGPVDIVLIGFPPDAPMTGEAVPILLNLVEQGVIRVLDVLFIHKEADGTFSGFDIKDLDHDRIGGFAAFEGAHTGLIGDEDVATAAEAVEPGSSAVLLVYENRWAAPFANAVRRNGGVLLATERVGIADLMEALDRLDD